MSKMLKSIQPANLKGANIRKFVEWNKKDGEVISGTAVLMVGYCPDTVPYFLAMGEMILQDFPDADPNQMTCAKVRESHYVHGYTVILAPIKGPKRDVKGWDESHVDFTY